MALKCDVIQNRLERLKLLLAEELASKVPSRLYVADLRESIAYLEKFNSRPNLADYQMVS